MRLAYFYLGLALVLGSFLYSNGGSLDKLTKLYAPAPVAVAELGLN